MSLDVDGIDSDDSLSEDEPIEIEVAVEVNIDDASSDDQAANGGLADDEDDLAAVNVDEGDLQAAGVAVIDEEDDLHAANGNLTEDEDDPIVIDDEQRRVPQPENDGNYDRFQKKAMFHSWGER